MTQKLHWTKQSGFRTAPRYDVVRKYGLFGPWVVLAYKNQGPYTYREAAREAKRRNKENAST